MDALTFTTIAALAVAAALYLGFHFSLRRETARAARAALAVAWALGTADIGVRCWIGQHPAASAAEATAFIAWLMAGGYLLASLRAHIDAGGALVVPASLALLLAARVMPAEAGSGARHGALGALGMLHISLATVGVAAFALAAVLGLLYLRQERALKRKEFDRLRAGGGTALDTLDALQARCVTLGFAVFTLAIVTGAAWVARLGLVRGGAALRPEYVFALAAWFAFGVLLVARVSGRFRGRRAAGLAVAGFASVLVATLGYLLRQAV